MKSHKSVDTYIKSYPKPVQKRLNDIRKIVKKIAAKAEEKMSYGMIGYLWGGMFVYIGAFERHIGFYPMQKVIAKFKKQLASYKTSKGTVQFQHDEPLPLPLVKKLVAYRAKIVQDELRAKAKAKGLTICSRGHFFKKTKLRPVCSKCYPGYYKKRAKTKK